MNTNSTKNQYLDHSTLSEMSFDNIESKLYSDLEESLTELESLKVAQEKIEDPSALSNTIKNVVWEQFLIQIGAIAGEDFIKENGGLTLDLRNSAHIQTTEDFEKGNIATHNRHIDYKDRYDKWKTKLAHNENGEVISYTDRSGKTKAQLAGSHVRKPFDEKRPAGSVERGTDMDHTIPAAEIIRDPHCNAHLSEKEQIDFANSGVNLYEMKSSHNRSKGDKAMSEWLDNPNKNGQKPDEIFDDLDEKLKSEYRKKDSAAREEFDNLKQEGEEKSIETGKQSQRQEAVRMGKKALQGIAMTLLAALVKEIFQKFAVWLKSKQKKFSSFIEKLKEAITKFIKNLKEHLKIAAQSAIGTLATMIIGPIVQTLQKAWTIIKQGYISLKEAIAHLKNPENKNKDFSILMMEVGQIIIGGLSAIGAIALSSTIQGVLSSVAFFSIEIPGLGSLASIIGIFSGAVISGLVGAIAIYLINRCIAKKQREIKTKEIIKKSDEVLQTQEVIKSFTEEHKERIKTVVSNEINQRHNEVIKSIKSSLNDIKNNVSQIYNLSENSDNIKSDNESDLKNILLDLDS